jgi:uncharacterized protein
MKRRSFLKKSIIGITSFGLLSGLYAWQVEPFWVEFVKLKMPIKNLPKNLVGKSLMQISDLHIGENFDYKYIIESLEKAKQYNPDFVVYTGDFITANKNEVQYDKLKEVLQNCVKGTVGTVGILGNHDYGENWMQQDVANNITKIATENGIHILRNEQIEIAGLNFIGLDDYWGLNFKPELVMQKYDANKTNIVLCHNPDVCDVDIWNGYEGWILSGHTHGGQVKPPFLDPIIVPVKNKNYTAGEIALSNNRKLYINRALGHLKQIRFNVRPEITIFELTSE